MRRNISANPSMELEKIGFFSFTTTKGPLSVWFLSALSVSARFFCPWLCHQSFDLESALQRTLPLMHISNFDCVQSKPVPSSPSTTGLYRALPLCCHQLSQGGHSSRACQCCTQTSHSPCLRRFSMTQFIGEMPGQGCGVSPGLGWRNSRLLSILYLCFSQFPLFMDS